MNTMMLINNLDLMGEISPQNTTDVTRLTTKSREKILWMCVKNEQHPHYLSRIDHRISGSACPVCSGLIPWVGVNDLATTHVELAKRWHTTLNRGLTPQMLKYGSSRKVWLFCEKCDNPLHIKLSYSPGLCKSCKIAERIGIDITHPDIASEWHPTLNGSLTPSDVTHGSNTSIYWVGNKCKHTWTASVKNRTILGRGCSVCSGRQIATGVNDLDTVRPHLKKEWHPTKNLPLASSDVTQGSDKRAWWLCNECDRAWFARVSDRSRGGLCPSCMSRSSAAEDEIAKVISLLLPNKEVLRGDKTAISRELDIYVPSKKLAIEFNGLYWHSEVMKKGRLYHAQKTLDCDAVGVQLLHVWEDEWECRRDVVVRSIASHLKASDRLSEPGVLILHNILFTERIGARKLSLELVSGAEAVRFMEQNHIQGFTSGTIYVAGKDNNGLVRALLIAKRVGNKGHEGEWMIERYATLGIVQGGFTKLLTYAENHIGESLRQWVTFADNAKSTGGLYLSHGFTMDKKIAPDYRYVVGKKRIHKFNYRLSRFKNDQNLKWKEGLTEKELADLNEIPRIWDAGKVRWVKLMST